MPTKAKEDRIIVIKRPPHRVATIPIVGTAELLMNRIPDWVLDEIWASNQGIKIEKKIHSEEEYYAQSIYRDPRPDGPIVFPGSAFKSAIVEAGLRFYGIPMTDGRVYFHVPPEWIPIVGERHCRKDMIRTQTGSLQVSVRAGFPVWSAVLKVRYPSQIWSESMIFNLVEASGLIGVGPHRPGSDRSNTGTFGTYTVADWPEGAGKDFMEQAE